MLIKTLYSQDTTNMARDAGNQMDRRVNDQKSPVENGTLALS